MARPSKRWSRPPIGRRVLKGLIVAALVGHATVTGGAPPEIGGEWSVVRSGRTVVISALSEKDTRRIAGRVVAFRGDVFGPTRPFRAPGSDVRKVFLFADRDLLRAVAPAAGAAGGSPFLAGDDGVDRLLVPPDDRDEALRAALSAEAFHLLGDASPRMPIWLRRGLAELYSTYRPDGNRVRIGHRIDPHFETLRAVAPIPWEQVVAWDRPTPEPTEPQRLRAFSAQAWILAHYLATETDAGEPGVARYVRRLDTGAQPDRAFREVFGFERAQLAGRGADYGRGRGFDPVELDRDEPRLTRPSSLPRAQVLAELGELAAEVAAREDDAASREERAAAAEEHLRAALQLDGELATAHRGLGAVQLLRGDAAGAASHLRRASELDPDDVHARLLLARALLRPFGIEEIRARATPDRTPAAVTEARAELLACLERDPDLVEAHVLLGATYRLDPDDPSPGIRTLQAVQPLQPGRPDVTFPLAMLLIRVGRPDAARDLVAPDGGAVWQRMRKTVSDEIARVEAEPRTLTAEEAERQYAEYMRALELSSARKYKKALDVLDGLLSARNDPSLHESIVQLHDQVRYNRALALFERGEFAAALDLAREVRRSTSQPGIRDLAKALAQSCRRALAN